VADQELTLTTIAVSVARKRVLRHHRNRYRLRRICEPPVHSLTLRLTKLSELRKPSNRRFGESLRTWPRGFIGQQCTRERSCREVTLLDENRAEQHRSLATSDVVNVRRTR